MESTGQLYLRRSPANQLQEILFGPHHVAWINAGGRITPWHGDQPEGNMILEDVCLTPGGPSQYTFYHVRPLSVERPGSRHEVDIREKEGRIELDIQSADPNGYFDVRSLLTIEPDPDRPGQLRIRYAVDQTLLKDLDAGKILRGERPDAGILLCEVEGLGPSWLFEMSDPWLDSVRGPAMKFTQDYPYRVPYAGNDAYTRQWEKRWNTYAFKSLEGPVRTLDLAFEKLIRNPRRYTHLLKPSARSGFFLSSLGNPVVQLESNEQIATSICQWIYDAHFYAVIPFHTPNELWHRSDRFNDFAVQPEQAIGDQALLKAERKVTFKTTTVVYSEQEARPFIAGARPIKLEAHEQNFYDGLPALTENSNDFSIPVSARPDANAWLPASIAVWDRTIGYRTPGSLRISNQSIIAEGAWSALGGRSSFCEPIQPGKEYRLRGQIKTISALGEGASLEVHITWYRNLGHVGEKNEGIITMGTDRVNGTKQWTPVEVLVPPLPEDCAYVQLVARLKGAGTAWFDEISFEPVE